VAAESGSHVVVRNPDKLERPPRQTARYAASLAARYSKAKNAGRVAVHMARCENVSKRRGLEPGKVLLEHSSTVYGYPAELD
jgi:predicted ribosome quality control (RQC) complex YloA/Tae2 family protein